MEQEQIKTLVSEYLKDQGYREDQVKDLMDNAKIEIKSTIITITYASEMIEVLELSLKQRSLDYGITGI